MLSNLGNITLNPSGALFFNLGCIITGILILPFIACFYWNTGNRLKQIIILLGIILGIFASISLIGVGVLPETHIKLHVLAASVVFESLFFIIILITIAIFNHPKFIHFVAYWGIAAVLINLLFVIVLSLSKYHNTLEGLHPVVPIPGIEWAVVFSSLIWIAMISYNMYKKEI